MAVQQESQRILNATNDNICSIVLPVFNECENISELYQRLTTVMQLLGGSYELLFVDDGSTDGSDILIKDLHDIDPCVKLVKLSRNFGHQMAVSAGMSLARGNIVICMDSDLQDAPEVIPAFVDEWKKGYDVVYAIRESRKEGLVRNSLYMLFYRLLKALSDTDIPLDSGDFSLMDRKVVDLINSLPEKSRFIRGLRAWVGFKQIGVRVHRDARLGGNPKYGIKQLFQLALSGLLSFSVVPLRIASTLGLLVSFTSFVSIILVLYIKLFTDKSLPGFAATASIVLFLGGMQLLTVGILGEYIGRIFDEVKGRPLFIVSETIGIPPGPTVTLNNISFAPDQDDCALSTCSSVGLKELQHSAIYRTPPGL